MLTARTILGASRTLVGVASWLAPDHTVRFFGIDPARADRFVTRLFGSRELALSGSLLAAPSAALASVAALGAAVDALDAASGFQEFHRGHLSARGALLGPGGAVGFVVLGVLAYREAVGPRPGE